MCLYAIMYWNWYVDYMTLLGDVVWWGKIIVVLILCYVAYKAIAQRAGFQEFTMNDIKRWF